MKDIQARPLLFASLPNDDILSQCIHCGLCLSVCPTYELTKSEKSSPRGRIRLINAVAKGELPITQTFVDEMSFCLDCQACETACPAGVKYGTMVEAARVEIDNAGFGSTFRRLIKKIALKSIIASPYRLKFVSKILYTYQKSGIQGFLHKSGLFKLVSAKLGEVDKLAPQVSKTFSTEFIPEYTKPIGEARYKTAFLTGCLMDVMFAEINKDTIDVLSACGCEVFSPKKQVCCGSLHAHNGDLETAKKLAKKNIDVFGKYEYQYLISNSAGCGAFMKEYGHVLEDDPEYSAKAKKFSGKVKDITEFLDIEKPIEYFDIVKETITYHDACHLAHTQKVVSEPRNLLKSIPGLKINELQESSWCCGSAGIYNIVRYDDSMKILERKMENIKNSGADVVITGNPGCIQQIKYGADKFNVNVKVLHTVTLIKEAISWKKRI